MTSPFDKLQGMKNPEHRKDERDSHESQDQHFTPQHSHQHHSAEHHTGTHHNIDARSHTGNRVGYQTQQYKTHAPNQDPAINALQQQSQKIVHRSASYGSQEGQHLVSKYGNPIVVEHAEQERVPTGIRGFDNLIQGGYKRGSVNLISGGPGTGKTIFAGEFLANGIKLFNEKAVFISFDEVKDNFISNMKPFGWDFDLWSKQGKFTFVEYNPSQLQQMLHEGGGLLDNLMSKVGARRVVIDSISTFLMMSSSDFKRREQLMSFFKLLKKWRITAVLVNEYTPITGNELSKQSLSIDFETDSIVQMYFMHHTLGTERKRFIEVYKMRGSKHLTKAVPYVIDEKGIHIQPGIG